MTYASQAPENPGFLTVVDHPRYGLVGGYLVLNSIGRPLEFHCTSPVKANRAQEILYGNTLEPYLYGEQIARTLLTRAKTATRFVLTDVPAVLAAQEAVEPAIVYVFDPKASKPAPGDDEPVAETIAISRELDASLKSFGIESDRYQAAEDEDRENGPCLPDVAGLDTRRWREFKVGRRTLALPGDREELVASLQEMSRTVDLLEPFTGIRLAIEEAQRA